MSPLSTVPGNVVRLNMTGTRATPMTGLPSLSARIACLASSRAISVRMVFSCRSLVASSAATRSYELCGARCHSSAMTWLSASLMVGSFDMAHLDYTCRSVKGLRT